MFRTLTRFLVGAAILGTPAAWAAPIGPGFDLFATDPGTTSVMVDTDPDPLVTTLVTVPLKGIPLGPPIGPLGDADTIVERKGALPSSTDGPIPIELVALSLHSMSPVTIGGTDFDLTILGGDLLIGRSSPDGSMSIMGHAAVDAGGVGTFDSTLPIDLDLIFTKVGDPTTTFPVLFTDVLLGSGIWGHTARADDPHIGVFAAGGFFPGVDPLSGRKHLTLEESLLAMHGVLPAQAPAPSPLLLLGGGLASLVLLYRFRRSR